ncbi:MAG: efflux RND transporter periplasmic adaptor subunit, partial [Elusimicrobia bacterium]|nr:efflux RND transporter periplasmic adaptor subunit [Elusimicrobiota bacterium]
NQGIGCLGRIEPEGGVIRVSAPYDQGRPALVAKLLVGEGDWVRKGQPLAVLQSAPRLEAELGQSRARLAMARARLENAAAEEKRYKALYKTHDVSSSELDARRLALETARSQLRAASADVARASAQAEAATVRAPESGRILKIRAKAGEEIGPLGLLDFGDTERLVVKAEVYETDIARLRLGQRATVSGDLLPAAIEGRVQRIGLEISKNSVLPEDPEAFSDSRIVKVVISLPEASSRALEHLLNGKVDVVIHP